MKQARKVLGWVIVGFIAYAVIKSPAQAADIVRTSFDIIAQGVNSIFSFFDSLLRR